MKKIILLAIPFMMALSACSGLNNKQNNMIEDTLAHEEIFGDLSNCGATKLEPRKSVSEEQLYTPILSFQHKDNGDNTYSLRFIATIQSSQMDVEWTRSVHNLSGSTSGGKAKDTITVHTVYEALNDNGKRVNATSIEEEDDELGTKPFRYFAVYCLLNIPNSVSDYYVDAFVTVTLGQSSKSSAVGSTNVADSTKHMKYNLGENSRYVASINGVARESDNTNDNHLALFSLPMTANDKLEAYYIDKDALTYTRYGYADLVRANPLFKRGGNGELVAKYDDTFNVYLNNSNQFSFERKIYFQGPSWWETNASTVMEVKKNEACIPYTMTYNGVANQYHTFVDITNFDAVQFYRQESGGPFNHTGWRSFPTNADNMFYWSESDKAGAWAVYGGEAPVIDETKIAINDITGVVDIHTALQKTFLEYQGDYSTMDPDLYPSGDQLLSDSEPVNLSWSYTGSQNVTNYTLVCGKEANLSDGYEIDCGTDTSHDFYNPYLGRNYYKVIVNGTEESAIHHFDVDTTYPRNLAIEGMTNCRDLGGRVLEDGGIIKQGLVFRTSGYNYNTKDKTTHEDEITDAGKAEMLSHLGVRTEINISDNSTYNVNLNGTQVLNFNMDYGGQNPQSSHHFSRNAESLKNFFEAMADSSNYPVFFHCRIGTDRTGLCAITLSGLLGVPLNEIYQDYLFSNFGKIQDKRYIGELAGQDNIQNYMNEIQQFSGKTFKNKVYNCLLSIGLSRTTLDTVIANLTEGTVAQGNNTNQVIARADVLTANDVEMTYDYSDHSHPDYYYTLNNSSQSVSYTFTAQNSYRGQVVAYLGNTSHSSNMYIADAIRVKLDDDSMVVRNITYADAGMGNCSNRMNYYPVILGIVDIPAGEHTITVIGSNNTMNIGGLYIFDGSTAIDVGGGELAHVHFYEATTTTNISNKQVTKYVCECGEINSIELDFLTGYTSLNGTLSDGDVNGKLGKTTVVTYDFPANAGTVSLQFALKMSASNHGTRTFNTSVYILSVDGNPQTLSIANGITYTNLGLTNTGFTYITFCSFEISNNKNVEITLDHRNTDYRLLFGQNVRLVYSAN